MGGREGGREVGRERGSFFGSCKSGARVFLVCAYNDVIMIFQIHTFLILIKTNKSCNNS